jgi:hypothetical protein
MNRYALLAFASLGFLPLAGCQNSGTAETSTTTTEHSSAGASGSAAAAGGTAAASASADPYAIAYTPTVDTSWMHTASDTNSSGTLHPGDTVYLRSDAPSSGVVAAKTTDGRLVYVRASDLKKK